jgi:hypothetical protein
MGQEYYKPMSAKNLRPTKARKRPVRKTEKVFCRFDTADALLLDQVADRMVTTRSEVVREGTMRFVREQLAAA